MSYIKEYSPFKKVGTEIHLNDPTDTLVEIVEHAALAASHGRTIIDGVDERNAAVAAHNSINAMTGLPHDDYLSIAMVIGG